MFTENCNLRFPLILILMLCTLSVAAQQNTGKLQGSVVDELGGVIVGATVTALNANGVEKSAVTNMEGRYSFDLLAPGTYTVRAVAKGFAVYQNTTVSISSARVSLLNIKLSIVVEERVTVDNGEKKVSTDPDSSASTTILRGADLDILSDDPDQLAADLQAISGGPEGPNGTAIVVDGFSRARLPSKSSILEVRVNTNPFTAEQDDFGFGRVEIVTKPGADKFSGSTFFNFNDESLNARNPFAPNRAPLQTRLYGLSLSGPLVAKKLAYFLDFERRDINENAIVNATVLDEAFNSRPFNLAVVTPQRRTAFSARLDHQLNKFNTLTMRYGYFRLGLDNLGVGGFSLPSRAFSYLESEHSLQISETWVVSPSVLNVTRFQFTHRGREQTGDNSIPTINVQEAFIGGGSQVGLASNNANRFELQNATTWIDGFHTWKAGGRVRYNRTSDVAPTNFGGTFIFTSLEQFRQVSQQVPGARPAQFTLNSGNPLAHVTRFDFGGFVQDDWRVRPDFTLSYGLRYETQTNISDRTNFAPRLSFAWAPGARAGGKAPLTVIRGGAGIFYYRFSDELTLVADRFNGINQQQFIVTNPNFFPNVPSAAELLSSLQRPTIRRIAEDSKAPSAYRATFSVERQLPRNSTLSISYIFKRDIHYPISRNINAPLPGTFVPGIPDSGVRPFGNIGNIFLFEPSGVMKSHTVFFILNSRFSKKVNGFAQFRLRREYANNDNSYTFPANSYDLRPEYGRDTVAPTFLASLGGTYAAPWGINLNTFVLYLSNRRFNITTGRDLNGDSIFTDRPALATDLTKAGVIVTRFGAFDPNVAPGDPIIPRNFGSGPSYFQVNLRASKSFTFGAVGGNAQGRAPKSDRYNLTFAIIGQNIFNHTNPGQIVGNLSSPFFGRSITAQSTQRRIDLQVRLNF